MPKKKVPKRRARRSKYVKRYCRRCNGYGKMDGKYCEGCEGLGVVHVLSPPTLHRPCDSYGCPACGYTGWVFAKKQSEVLKLKGPRIASLKIRRNQNRPFGKRLS